MILAFLTSLALVGQDDAAPNAAASAMPVYVSVGGDDALTGRFVVAIMDGNAWRGGDCWTSCLSVTVAQVQPEGRSSFRWRIETNETHSGGRSAMRLETWTGTCDERDIAACGKDIRSRIDGVVRDRSTATQVSPPHEHVEP